MSNPFNWAKYYNRSCHDLAKWGFIRSDINILGQLGHYKMVSNALLISCNDLHLILRDDFLT